MRIVRSGIKVFFIVLFVQNFFLFSVKAQDELKEIKQSILEYQQEKDSLNLSRAWYKLGRYYYEHDSIEKSNEAVKKALYWVKILKNDKGISVISNYLATNFSYIGETDSALHYFEVALEACINEEDQQRKANILVNYSDELASIGKYTEATQNAIQAIRIKESLNDSSELAFAYQNVGEIYKLAGETDKWEEYVQKAYRLKDCEECTDLIALTSIYNDLGGIAEKKSEYDKALQYYDTLISIGKEYEYESAINVALSNSATIYKLQGNYSKALELALESQQYQTNNAYQIVYDKILLAELFLATNNLTEAKKNINLAIQDKNLNNYLEEKTRAFKTYYEIEKRNKNFEQALFWNEKYKELSDSIRNKEVRAQIVKMDIAYQTEKKEQQILLLETKDKLKSHRIKIGIFMLIGLLIITSMLFYILQIRKRQAKLTQNELHQKLLRSQMNPHFLFNALGSIHNFMLKNETSKAAMYLNNFSSLTRSILEHSATEFIPLSEEISTLRNYIKLEQMRLQNSFSYYINYNEDLETEFINIPPMLIQPFVENAIKHGLRNLNYEGLLTINIVDKIKTLHVQVIDNGLGFDVNKQKDKKHNSMALDIFEQRRKVLSKNYNCDINLSIKDYSTIKKEKTGTVVEIIIPIAE